MVNWGLAISMLFIGAFIIWVIIRSAQQFSQEQEQNPGKKKKDNYKGGLR